jgi:hypothetical protein
MTFIEQFEADNVALAVQVFQAASTRSGVGG